MLIMYNVIYYLYWMFLSIYLQAVWPTLRSVVDSYGDRLAFTVHIFPLPYHQAAFTLAQAAIVVQQEKPQNIWNFFDLCYRNQSQIWNSNISKLTSVQLTALVGTWATSSEVGLSEAAWTAGMNNSYLNMAARASWKLAASRSVTGTPWFFLNGKILDRIFNNISFRILQNLKIRCHCIFEILL